MRILTRILPTLIILALWSTGSPRAEYLNFEVSHVHPLALTPSGARLLAVNTPDAILEVFTVESDGSLTTERSIPVGLEPVTVAVRSESEAWVVNNLSDTISIVDLTLGLTVKTLAVGDEPSDVVFTATRAFVAVSQEDAVKVFDLSNLDAAPSIIDLAGRDVRALAVSNDGQKVYAVLLRSGNGTTVIGVPGTFPGVPNLGLDPARLTAMNLRDIGCEGLPPIYPGLPAGVVRNPALTDPPDGIPKVGLIVAWDETSGEWHDELGQDWSHCLPYSPADRDLFIINASNLHYTSVPTLGTALFDVSVHPTNDKVYIPNTDARNAVRFEHPLGVQGHVVDNVLTVVDPGAGNAVTKIDLNGHIVRSSDPATNLVERQASISQPGMMVWTSDGSTAYLTAIGSRKLFRVDGACLTDSCIFGTSRATPDAVEVGEGPTGVALLEAAQPEDERLYVLNRISHSIATVQAATLSKLDEIPLHDPSPAITRFGRRFLYDAIDTSGHGDGACSSCHLSGDMDGLAWDLGNPAGDFAPYSTPMDNVRFVVPNFPNEPLECPASVCADHDGFDPQKGPMTTQTLRGMLEPLHWRGDRSTMNAFNAAFVGLMGTADIGPVNGQPAGLTASDMERFRQFALAMQFPPNPYRTVDDLSPCGPRSTDPTCEILVHGGVLPGNPTEGELLFDTHASDAGQPCVACHSLPFGAGGGATGGVTPLEPTSSDAAALFFGAADGSPHSDLKIPHLRNMYDKIGPVTADVGDASMPPTPNGFGFTHDGSMPDLLRFLSAQVFTLSAANQAQEVRDIASFMFHFPTGTRPAVGRQVTLPQGTPPTGSADDEMLLSSLIALGDLSDAGRHCELVSSTIIGGIARRHHLSGGNWISDVAGEPALATQALREAASAPITFTCATIGSGMRLGGDRDEDAVLDGNDCAAADGDTWAEASTVTDVTVALQPETLIVWSAQGSLTGPSQRYDAIGGLLSDLDATPFDQAECIGQQLADASFVDTRPDPPSGAGYFYLIRAVNPCGAASLGAGREILETLECN